MSEFKAVPKSRLYRDLGHFLTTIEHAHHRWLIDVIEAVTAPLSQSRAL